MDNLTKIRELEQEWEEVKKDYNRAGNVLASLSTAMSNQEMIRDNLGLRLEAISNDIIELRK